MSNQVEVTLDTATKIVNFTLRQGADFSMDIVYKENGVVVPITGWHAYAELRDKAGGQLYHRYTDVGTLGITITGASGLISWEIPKDDITGFTFDECVYDLYVNTGTVFYCLFTGKIPLEKRITQV